MTLATYNAKRDFRKTAEPKGATRRSAADLRFVVQKHDASHLHYDFRLELDGVLLSWAVPKGPSRDPAKKALAVRVEDHPVDYAGFEGIIPKDEYGGGTVAIWDQGTWQPIGDARDGLRTGKLSFVLHGERLAGEWTLVRIRGADSKNWLLIKKQDAFATRASIRGPDSVASGRTLKEIADGKTAKRGVQHRSAAQATIPTSKAPRGSAHLSAAHALPAFTPQLATLADAAPIGKEWVHEIKFDGYRLQARIEHGTVTLLTRNGHDWTHRFKPIAEAFAALPVRNAILDGEAVVLDAAGRSDFQALQRVLKKKDKATPLFVAFDLPYLDDKDLRPQPLRQRTRSLARLLKPSITRKGSLRLSEQIRVEGDAVLTQACKLGLEGIISNRLDAPYVSRRDKSWLKVKCGMRQEFVIVGFTQPQRSRVGIGALLLGYHDGDQQLVYAGRVGTGFDTSLLKSLRSKLEALTRQSSPLGVEAPARERNAATWVTPTLVAEVSFTGWTRDAHLRHPVFVGLRSDKSAKEIVREDAVVTPAVRHTRAGTASKAPLRRRLAVAMKPTTSATATKQSSDIAGVALSHPDKLLFPDVKLTKKDLATYAHSVAKWMLPHVSDRPLALVRCPDGQKQKCFFQRNWSDSLPDALRPVDVGEGREKDEHLSLHDERGLISLVQMGVLEVHTWNCSANDIESPDQLVFDLDPADDVAWKQVIQSARLVRDELETLRLPVFLKTSGGKGLHLVVPLKPTIDWATAKSFSGDVARHLAESHGLFVANMRKDLRRGKIYIDFHRNGRGSTSVAPYSVRARPGAPVSMPTSWEELGKLPSASHFTVETARRYLKRRKSDPWKAFDRSRVDLHQMLRRASAA